MGVDFTAYAAVGMSIDHDTLFRKQKIKRGRHDFPENVSFHPDTGVRLWEEVDFRMDRGESGDSFLDEFPIVEGTYCDYGPKKGQCRTYVICAIPPAKADDDKDGFIPIDPTGLERVKANLRRRLEEHGLWDERRFGVHAILDCSY